MNISKLTKLLKFFPLPNDLKTELIFYYGRNLSYQMTFHGSVCVINDQVIYFNGYIGNEDLSEAQKYVTSENGNRAVLVYKNIKGLKYFYFENINSFEEFWIIIIKYLYCPKKSLRYILTNRGLSGMMICKSLYSSNLTEIILDSKEEFPLFPIKA